MKESKNTPDRTIGEIVADDYRTDQEFAQEAQS